MRKHGVPLGIGVDAVTISEIARLDREACAFSTHTFTIRELDEANRRSGGRASYLAGRFAVKEAAFKALAHLTPEKTFDMRIIETLTASDGSPQIQMTPALLRICKSAGVGSLLVSISNEGDLAIAFSVALSG